MNWDWSLITNYLADNWLQLTGVVTAALGIWLTTRRLLICWPITLVSIFIYMVVFYRSGLLSDALLQVFFVVFTFYGWWHWWRGVRDEGQVRVVPLPLLSLIIALVLGGVGSFVLG